MKVVYLSAVPWLSINQRPHFFAKYGLTNGINNLLWIEPYVSRFPSLADLIPGRHALEPSGLDIISGLELSTLGLVIPIEPINFLFKLLNKRKIDKIISDILKFISNDTILVIGKPSLLGLILIEHFKWRSIWYDAMDDFPSFYSGISRRNTIRMEKEISIRVDRILCSSHALMDKFSIYGEKKTSLVLNACADELCSSHIKRTIFSDKIIFGYIGTIASWFDWNWVKDLAEKNPDALIKIVGPIKTKIPLFLNKNIVFEAPIPHYKVMEKISEFDAVIIPFIQNELTKHVDPVKFYEYQLAGKPILSTPFGEMLWHYRQEPQDYNFNVPENTLVFPPPQKESHVPRWSERFCHVFNDYRR